MNLDTSHSEHESKGVLDNYATWQHARGCHWDL